MLIQAFYGGWLLKPIALTVFMNLIAPFPLTFESALVNLSSIERKKENFLCHFPRWPEVSPTFVYLLQNNMLNGKVAGKCMYKMLNT